MSRSPFTPAQKNAAVEDFLKGFKSNKQIRDELGIASKETVRKWVLQYQIHGVEAFSTGRKNNSFSKEFKINVVEEYIAGKGSIPQLVAKYKIPAYSTLNRWISVYNSDIELKDYDPKQEVYMAGVRRKTTKEERIEIVDYCFKHNHDYKATAEIYGVSYNQVYSWVKKYDEVGEEGLSDKRGRHKTDEKIDELEKLRRENKRLKHRLEEKDMTVELLKKVQEFERRRYSPKEN